LISLICGHFDLKKSHFDSRNCLPDVLKSAAKNHPASTISHQTNLKNVHELMAIVENNPYSEPIFRGEVGSSKMK
jgi:hypothetical protein